MFLRDTVTGLVGLVSQGLGGSLPNGNSWAMQVAVDATGSTVVFGSEATNLVAGDSNGLRDVFVLR